MDEDHKAHRAPAAGARARKKKAHKERTKDAVPLPSRQANPKAFAPSSGGKAILQARRKLDIESRKLHVPVTQRAIGDDAEPPVIVAVVGPPGVGKTTVIKSLVKHYTRQTLRTVKGPMTVISGKKRRLTLMECPVDLAAMADVAKVADLVLLVIDAHYGFEMETFEFLNLLQVHGFPRVMGVLTHLDEFKSKKGLSNAKKQLKKRFWAEIYQGAKLFYLSGLVHGRYPKNEIHNLARFISVMKFRPLTWRNAHPYLLADRLEDLTHPQTVADDKSVSRTVALYGYLRGTRLRDGSRVHVAGVGDFSIAGLSLLPDPCPLPDSERAKRYLSERDRLLYAPMADVSNVFYDKDATYIDIPDHKVSFTRTAEEKDADDARRELGDSDEPLSGEQMVMDLQSAQVGIDERLETKQISLFSGGAALETTRKRRPAPGHGSDDDDGSEGESDDDDDEDMDEDMDDSDEDDDLFRKVGAAQAKSSNGVGASSWERNRRLNEEFLRAAAGDTRGRTSNLMEVVYGDHVRDNDDDDDDDDDDLLRLVTKRRVGEDLDRDRVDSSKAQVATQQCRDWGEQGNDDDAVRRLVARFTKSDWFAGDDAAASLDDDEELYGDFEDLEEEEGDSSVGIGNGTSVQKATDTAPESDVEMDESDDHGDMDSDDEQEEDVDDGGLDADLAARLERVKRKEKLKAQFNSDYDESEGGDFVARLKASADAQQEINEAEWAGEDPEARAQFVGYAAGAYVRLELQEVPCELVEFFDPHFPLLVGGLLANEQQLGMLQVRIKKHRWHRKILKNQDPIIVSMGWRRFQTMPQYSLADDSLRHRSLKYTPEHMHCFATFHGPLTPPNTGFIAFQTLTSDTSGFRVAASGVVLELDQSFRIFKKLKLTGTPYKIKKHTAFIKGMFTSALEVAKFEGGAIRTVSGIRGQIKKPLNSPPGAFRATFEDKILLSDVVFLRTWYPVQPRAYYNPVTTLLSRSKKWEGMRTVFQKRKEEKIAVPVVQDSLYKPIEREDRKFNPLRIPKTLEKELPFASKPKLIAAKKKRSYAAKRAVVLEAEEKRAYSLMQQLRTVKNEKVRKRKQKQQARMETKQRLLAKEQQKRDAKAKEARKRVYKQQGIEELRAKRQRTGGSYED